jgi:hypothetical protein
MLKSGSIRFDLICVLKLHFTFEFKYINKTYCSNSWSGFWDGPTCASDKSLIAWAVSIQPQQEKEMIGMFVCNTIVYYFSTIADEMKIYLDAFLIIVMEL